MVQIINLFNVNADLSMLDVYKRQIFEGLQSEIFVPITPKPVWAPVTKELKDMKVALRCV